MDSLSRAMKILLNEPNKYEHDISLYCEILSYLPFFEDATETDYIVYHDDHSFEYTPQLYSFIKALFDSKMVEDVSIMTDFLKQYKSQNAYKLWIKDMNAILSNEKYQNSINLSFIRKTIFSMIKLEKIMPGSWGIDVETGNWLKLLRRLNVILPEVYQCRKQDLN
jgi:vesicle coat complex subunit